MEWKTKVGFHEVEKRSVLQTLITSLMERLMIPLTVFTVH